MSASRGHGAPSGASPDNKCARTNAVLAVHLDGDLVDNERESLDREQFGYGFVSDDSLHNHLRECASCQQALQRARRLDAVLASTAGRCVMDHAVADGGSIDDLTDRLLNRALLAAADGATVGPMAPFGACEPVGVGGPAIEPTGLQVSEASVHAADQSTRTGTWIAGLGVAAACAATWLCFASFHSPSLDGHSLDGHSLDGHSLDGPGVHGPGVHGPEIHDLRQQLAHTSADTAKPEDTNAPNTNAPNTNAPNTNAPNTNEPQSQEHRQPEAWSSASLPASLAQRMHAARNRELPSQDLPSQRTASPRELAVRLADRQLSVPDRLAAARRLIQATRTGSVAARHATEQLLAALASCGDNGNHELTVHEQLLDMLRSNTSLLVRVEQRLLATLELDGFEAATTETYGAIVVAARVGDKRLDSVLRRLLRRHDEVGDAIASGLRCGVRLHGAGKLLLDCWHDQVASGRQENTPKWAQFWFRGQSLTSFAELAGLRLASRSHADRVRCCLAMGCVTDDSTLPALLAALKSPRRDESCAAAWGIATLPHRVLKQLLPKAKVQSAGMLRAALARAGLRQADPWLEQLALSKPQLQLLRTGPLRRFPEVVAWFRNGPPLAD